MERDDGPSASNKSTVIKAGQETMERLDVLVCGQCHSLFHFIEEFQEHRSKEGACSKTSCIHDTIDDNRQKAQEWAFLLWKGIQIQDSSDIEASNTSTLHEKWCKMDTKMKEAWVISGKIVQTLTKINNAKMQDTLMQSNTNVESAKPIIVRKVVRNEQPEETGEAKKDSATSLETKKNESMEIEVDKKEKSRLKSSIKPKTKSDKATTEEDADQNTDQSNEEYIIDKILAKRFNTEKRCSEYLIKWEGYPDEKNTWESAEFVATYKSLLDEFERSHAKQKESKEAQQKDNTKVERVSLPLQKSVIKTETSQPGPSTAQTGRSMRSNKSKAMDQPGPSTTQIERSMRSNKSKAMDQIKQWCDLMKDKENKLLNKRRIDDSKSDSEKGGSSTSKETTDDASSDDEWTGEDERPLSQRIQRSFNRTDAQSSRFDKTSISSTELTTSLELQSADEAKSSQPPVLVANTEEVVNVDPKQMPNLASDLNVTSRKDSIIKLNSPIGKLAVKGSSMTQGVAMVQNQANINIINYKCGKCSKIFICELHLHKHEKIHKEESYQCEFCGKVFAELSNVYRHKREIHFNVHKDCDDCKKGFDNEQDLNNHLVTKHSDIERPYKCDTCSATFKRLNTLKQHINIHASEKPYVCKTYSHSARDEQHLKKLARQSLEMTNETRIYRRKQQLDKNQFFEQEEGLLYGPDIAD
ncbi:PREDICTED: zinc finger protein with KRAB and SCAN domains 8-like [Atta colombica]|uniref:zinc finger protein with KRAB and SCAN domains 8-like n=1 Tax=Atta colombica TaxID=520822 RepID=UPI00084C6E4E|nr:PREDICTED: zinc finger protein with KRAB and SCAN domains 8-like [Atta colombica]